MIFIYCLVFFVLGCFTGGLIDLIKSKSKKMSSYLRRGILIETFNAQGGSPSKNKIIHCQIEIGELEVSGGLSKIEILHIGVHNTFYIDQITNRLNHTWVNSSEIIWINETNKKRDEIINKILN